MGLEQKLIDAQWLANFCISFAHVDVKCFASQPDSDSKTIRLAWLEKQLAFVLQMAITVAESVAGLVVAATVSANRHLLSQIREEVKKRQTAQFSDHQCGTVLRCQ